MKKMIMSKKDLKKIKIEITEKGFVLWIKENSDKSKAEHWLIDASCLREDGKIRISGTKECYDFGSIYVPECQDNDIECVQLIKTE